MNSPTTHSVISRLVALSDELDRLDEDLDRLDREATEAAHTYEVSYARVFLTAAGSVDSRKQQAVLACQNEKFAKEAAEQALRTAERKFRKLTRQLEVGRSLNAAVRTEWTTQGVGQS
ncbi:hypothetical protein SAMN06265360_10662 [Haloechinothrix alba]|uniref:ESX-1 secretion-associated protein n=1 Tax=Haloechinothrix alba TaxID=664784 RepID=A0A238WE78_9PSEU|nr:hypothetical protein [Haloechinothrix alba]SNR44584.1 hypothetical protein SAMN06265360_10662 [Haloechinothrix alba]